MIYLLDDIHIRITPLEILDYLYPLCVNLIPDGKIHQLRSRSASFAEDASGRLGALLSPAAVYRILSESELLGWKSLSGQEYAVAGIATAGKEIDHEIQSLQASGSMLEALFLDAAGSLAAEACCDAADRSAGHLILERGLQRTKRVSPGFDLYPIEDQKHLFNLVPAKKINVRLTPECMMDPSKSVSFFFAAGSKPVLPYHAGSCSPCASLNCPRRPKTQDRSPFYESQPPLSENPDPG